MGAVVVDKTNGVLCPSRLGSEGVEGKMKFVGENGLDLCKGGWFGEGDVESAGNEGSCREECRIGNVHDGGRENEGNDDVKMGMCKGLFVEGVFVEGLFVEGVFVEGVFVEGLFVEGVFVEGVFVEGVYF